MSALGLLLFSLVSTVHGGAFPYNQCNSTANPQNWGSLSSSYATCGTTSSPQTQGTPVNLCGAVAFSGTTPSFVVSGYSTSRTMTGVNYGYTIQANVVDSSRPTLSLGNIAYTVGRSSNSSTLSWALQQVHVHVGRTGKTNEGSEHYMQGVAYPMEAHLVHYNTKYANISTAVASGSADSLLVVGVFLELGSTDVALLKTLADNIPSLSKTASTISTTMKASDLFDGTGSYYSYPGSLTTPGCNEIVTWVVMKSPKSITTDTLNAYKQASADPGTSSSEVQGTYGTFRPLQTIGSRTIYSSDGASAACTTVSDLWTCSAGMFLGPSVVLQLLALWLTLVNYQAM